MYSVFLLACCVVFGSAACLTARIDSLSAATNNEVVFGGPDETELSFCMKEDAVLRVYFRVQQGCLVRACRDNPRVEVFTPFELGDFMDVTSHLRLPISNILRFRSRIGAVFTFASSKRNVTTM